MKEEDFSRKFEKLVCAVANLGKIHVHDDEKKMVEALDGIINYFNNIWGCSFQGGYVSKKDVQKYGDSAFMFTSGDKVYYSVTYVKDMKKKIQQSVSKEYNPDYHDITYAMFLVNVIAHEMTHCAQTQDLKDGKLSFETYCHALTTSVLKINPEIIHCLERSIEHEAYGTGAGALFAHCNKETLQQDMYYHRFREQMKTLNFFSKNLIFAKTIYCLGVMPFVRNNYGFVDLVSYANTAIAKVSQTTRNGLFSKYPQLNIGMNKNGKMKTPVKLMSQFHSLIGKANDTEREDLYKIYVYLFVPSLTKEVYSGLCLRFGEKYMEKFMIEIQKSINEMIDLYEIHAREALKGVAFLKNDKLLQGINEQYVKLKQKSSLDFLQNCSYIVNECLEYKSKKY